MGGNGWNKMQGLPWVDDCWSCIIGMLVLIYFSLKIYFCEKTIYLCVFKYVHNKDMQSQWTTNKMPIAKIKRDFESNQWSDFAQSSTYRTKKKFRRMVLIKGSLLPFSYIYRRFQRYITYFPHLPYHCTYQVSNYPNSTHISSSILIIGKW